MRYLWRISQKNTEWAKVNRNRLRALLPTPKVRSWLHECGPRTEFHDANTGLLLYRFCSLDVATTKLLSLFLERGFTNHEIKNFKSIFSSHAEKRPDDGSSRVWTESTLNQFLRLPEAVEASNVLFRMTGHFGSFPFEYNAPAPLTKQALIKAIILSTGRQRKILPQTSRLFFEQIYRALAVYDQPMDTAEKNKPQSEEEAKKQGEENERNEAEVQAEQAAESSSSSRSKPSEPSVPSDSLGPPEPNRLAVAALEAVSLKPSSYDLSRPNIRRSSIPFDDLLRIVELMLASATLAPTESLDQFTRSLNDARIQSVRRTAHSVLGSFYTDGGSGVSADRFISVVEATFPLIFEGMKALFEHFLFVEPDVSPTEQTSPLIPMTSSLPDVGAEPSPSESTAFEPAKLARRSSYPDGGVSHLKFALRKNRETLLSKPGNILGFATYSQLAFFLPVVHSTLFHPLYTGSHDGFGMNAFERHVFKFSGPTLLLVRGQVIPDNSPLVKSNPSLREFRESIPHSNFPSSPEAFGTAPEDEDAKERSTHVTYGAFVPTPWCSTPTVCFSSKDTILFQIEPRTFIFKASQRIQHYAYFNESDNEHPGVGFGSPAPCGNQRTPTFGSATFRPHRRRSSFGFIGDQPITGPPPRLPLGPVSLHLDTSFEFGVFNHDSSGGGSFRPSPVAQTSPTPFTSSDSRPTTADSGADPNDDVVSWQDRFLVTELEVWGLGKSPTGEELVQQALKWDWEQREVERRRGVNLRSIDRDADRELLKMAGIIKDDGGGGSV